MPFYDMGSQGALASVIAILFTSFPCPADLPDRAVIFSLARRRLRGITIWLCEVSLTRVLGSVTLAIDKARKGA